MSLIVDTKNINLERKNLDRYIEEYRNNSYDIFFELSKLDSYWRDKRTILFNEKINVEKENNLLILENLEKINNFYKKVEEIYDNKY